jgi:hypothetical protein
MYSFGWSNPVPQTANHNPYLNDMERLTHTQPSGHQQDEYDSSPEHHSTHADHGQEYDPTARTRASISQYFPDNHQTSSARSMQEHNGPQSNSRPRRNAHHHSGNQDRYIAAGPASWTSPSSTPYVNLGPFAQGGNPHGRSNQPPLQREPSMYRSALPEQHSMPRHPQQYSGQPRNFHVPQNEQHNLPGYPQQYIGQPTDYHVQQSHIQSTQPGHVPNLQMNHTSTPNHGTIPYSRPQAHSTLI